jgi:hypothetical protein
MVEILVPLAGSVRVPMAHSISRIVHIGGGVKQYQESLLNGQILQCCKCWSVVDIREGNQKSLRREAQARRGAGA